jgi:hypothetical protein
VTWRAFPFQTRRRARFVVVTKTKKTLFLASFTLCDRVIT